MARRMTCVSRGHLRRTWALLSVACPARGGGTLSTDAVASFASLLVFCLLVGSVVERGEPTSPVVTVDFFFKLQLTYSISFRCTT